MTNVNGVFACGNVLHVHDLVDYVSQEAQRCADSVIQFLNGQKPRKQIAVKAGPNLKYVLPNKIDPHKKNHLLSRPLIVKNNAKCIVRTDKEIVFEKKLSHVQPAEMITLDVFPKILSNTKEIEVLLQ